MVTDLPIEGPDRVIIAANPRAGAGSPTSTVQRLAENLRLFGLHVDVLTDLGRVTTQAEQAQQAGTLRALVAAGGDGTVAELVNRTSVGTPITVFPLGTANLLAGYLHIRPDISRFARMIVDNRPVWLDAGSANGRIFLLMAGCGFDGEVVDRLHSMRQGHISMWSYAKPIIDSIRSYQYPELRIWADAAHSGEQNGVAPTLSARWAFIVNLPRYAANLQFAPQASGTDGKLDLCTFRQGSLWHGLRYLSYIWARQHTRLDDCRSSLARRLRIEADRPVRYQLDGDPGGLLPLDVEVLPRRLHLLVPPAVATALGTVEHEVTDRA